ncbi:MAG: energy-coupling factor ABC transporter permease [Methanomicrobiales archaeon]|nr:energy-coupling factor ABC transporter permease [Methanomicrobiales archaeon]
MHIMEGFLPLYWCIFWSIISFPFVAYGVYLLKRLAGEHRDTLPLLAVSGAFIFVLSSLKLPSVTGSCSHPTGTGLGAILFGPFLTAILGVIVLLYQAVFLAHGGLTTLGANVFSMAIAGPFLGYGIYRGGKAIGLNTFVTIFLAAALTDLFTYVITSLQLALAFPAQMGGIITSFTTFAAIFALTQIPLAIMEGIIIALTFKHIIQARADILLRLNVLTPDQVKKVQESIA